jgi:hypothetical protein
MAGRNRETRAGSERSLGGRRLGDAEATAARRQRRHQCARSQPSGRRRVEETRLDAPKRERSLASPLFIVLVLLAADLGRRRLLWLLSPHPSWLAGAWRAPPGGAVYDCVVVVAAADQH